MLNSEEVWPLWAVTVGVAIPVVAVLITCICCRKTVPKNELLGLAGMVKITNSEENLNHNQHSNETDTCTVIGSGVSCADTTESNKRASATANRSLPDIPVDSERIRLESRDTLWENNEPNGDTSSELYATVEENKHVVQPLATRTTSGANKKRPLQDGPTDESKSSERSSFSQTDDSFSPYAHLKAEHPYDKLKSEHPYAQVGASNGLDSTIYDLTHGYGNLQASVQCEDSRLLLPSTSGDNTPRPLSSLAGISTNPVPPPRTRKSSSHNSLLLAPTATLLPGSVPDIQAATAIAGQISANQELPYMTPPISAPEMNPSQQQEVNFSGDSQDSKGYTSISVREPLANIKAQTKVANQRSRTQELVDSHYATVSDDSDEMYAAIDEPGQVYTSGSETYAQIQPLAMLEVTPEAGADSAHYPPQPPSVDSLKQVAQVHSRQASSSSAASSIANLGSPKPEKRQANSPLPPPPAGSPDLYAAVDKKCTGLTVSRNLEEMYAKVMKKKHQDVGPDMDQGQQSAPSMLEHTDNLSHTSIDTTSSQGSPELRTQQEADRISACSSDHDSVVGLGSATKKLDPGYEMVYESPSQQFLIPTDVAEPSYESLGGPSSISTSYHDPGYEVVQQCPSDCDPNYEELRPQCRDSPVSDFRVNFDHTKQCGSESNPEEAITIKNGSSETPGRLNIEPGYEQVRSGGQQIPRNSESGPHSLVRLEPGFEQMRSAVQEVSYVSVNKNCSSVSEQAKINADTDYADVVRDSSTLQPDPGYEQVKSQSGGDMEPHVTNKHSVNNKEHDLGYEQVNLQDRCNGACSSAMRDSDSQVMCLHPSYERAHSKGLTDTDTYNRPEPGYASVDRDRGLPDDSGEPNYESMSSEGQDMVFGMTDDPNYESVSYFDLPSDPPYERLHNETRDSDGFSSGYEKVKDHSDLSATDTDEKELAGSYLEPGYEEVGIRWDVVNGDSITHCNSSSSIEFSLPERSCQLKEDHENLCRPQIQTSPTRM